MKIDDLPMHKDTYFFGYGIDIEKPTKMANQIIKLRQENQKYKEVIDRLKEYIQNNTLGFDATNGDILINEKCLFDILKEVE